MATVDDLLRGCPPLRRKKGRIHERHKLAVGTATIRSDINVTPLVDVVLVLLIIFMVVTPMITRGRPVQMPLTLHHDQKQDSGENIVVSIACEGPKVGVDRVICTGHSVWVGQERADEASVLADKIQKELRTHTSHEVHIKADKRLDYGPVREVMEHVHDAGVPSVALGSDEKKEK